MALRQLSEIRGLQDPLKQSQVEFIISDTPGLLLAKLTQKVAGALSGNKKVATANELRLRCTSFSYPGSQIKKSELVLGTHKRTSGTVQDKSGTWHCQVTEDFEGSVLNIICAWCDLIHSPILGTRLPRTAYVTDAQVIIGGDVRDPHTGKKLDKRTIWLKGFYPIGYKVSTINPSSSEPVSVDIDFNYDYFADNSYSIFRLFS